MASGELLSRRSFLIGVSAVGGGLALSLAVPFDSVRTAEEAPEVTAWLLIGTDNSVVIRVARAEMGQGAHTGLAMLVAEELECDWSKVSTEFVSPQENSRRERVWGDMSTGASRSIAASQLYLRQAGATARRNAAHGRGRALEGSGVGMRRRQERDHAPSERAQGHVRCRRRSGGESAAARRRKAQRPERMDARRHAAATPRRAR